MTLRSVYTSMLCHFVLIFCLIGCLYYALWSWLTSCFIAFGLRYVCLSGFGGLGVAFWPLVPKFAGSNPTEAVGFLRAKKSSARLPSEGK